MTSARASESYGSPGVSVVIPTYNYAQFLPQAIDSVLKQNYWPYEIVVVDDGSTDNTASVVAQYGQPVRYLYQANAGLPAARNAGIRAARHDYIGFLDADDQWLPDLLKRAMETFARLPAEFGLMACRGQFIAAGGQIINMKRLRPLRDEEVTARDILLKSRFGPSGVVVKRTAFDQCGYFDTALRSSEDRDMWIRIAARWRIFLLHDCLVLACRHASNMSNHADRMKASIREVIGKAYHNQVVPHHCFTFWLRVLSFYRFQSACMYHAEGRRGEAAQDMILSLILWPCFQFPHEFNEPHLFRVRGLLGLLAAGDETQTMPLVNGADATSGSSVVNH